MKTIVLGAGRVGSAIARDLSLDHQFRVHVADRDEQQLKKLETEHGIRGERIDFSLPSTVARAIADADLVINAAPGFLGYQTLRTVLDCGKNVVDIAFFPEDPFTLDSLAKRRGVRAIVDCGVAPGLSNLLVGRAYHRLDRAQRIAVYVGGLPVDRVPPFEYRAPFSPIDVIEEYTRPARVVEDARIVIRPALSEREPIEVPGIGTLEAFVTDGLRTLLHTVDAPQRVEKTLRYPGHAEKVELLREIGLFSPDPIDLDGTAVRPIDLTTALLFPLWQMKPADEDFTFLRVVVDGESAGEQVRITYELLDRFDPRTNISSMARTTGYTATMVARLLAHGGVRETGIIPPEHIGRSAERTDFILAGLQQRGITVTES